MKNTSGRAEPCNMIISQPYKIFNCRIDREREEQPAAAAAVDVLQQQELVPSPSDKKMTGVTCFLRNRGFRDGRQDAEDIVTGVVDALSIMFTDRGATAARTSRKK